MNDITTNSKERPPASLKSRRAWFPVMASVQIVTGVFYVMISLMAVAVLLQGDPMLGFGQPVTVDEGNAGNWLNVRNLIERSLALQVVLGGVLGLITIWAGVLTKRRTGRATVKWVGIANLLYFPVGTTVGTFLLLGLSRPSVKQQFGHSRSG